MSGVKVEYLLKAQESQIRTQITQNDERILTHSRTLSGKFLKLRDVLKERHEILSKQLKEMKVLLQTQIEDIQMLLDSEVKKFHENSTELHKKLDVVADTITRLIEDIISFNK